jgi:probable HAF family extracellular repeat protein
MTGLGFLAGNTNSSAIDVNSDGSVVVGHSGDGAVNQAFRWTQSGGMSGLGFLAGGINSYASGVSSDGSVVVGHSNDGLSNTAYVWTQSSGMQLVNDWLTANGVDVAPDFALSVAIDVSADGRTILAQNVNINPTKLYIVSIGGAISMTDLERGLSEGGASSQTVNASTITVLNSAHHRPLSHRVAQGKYTAWVSGDWGYDEHGSRDGSFGLAEIALGYNFGPIQSNIGLGKTWGKQDLSNDGRTDTDSIYFLAEVLTPLHPLGHGEVWASVTALHHWSDIDTRRGYLNAGLVDTSSGDTDSRTWSIRARLDWDKAIQLAGVTVSPYVSLSYSDTKVDSYTETAGGFPADFDDIRTYSKEFQFGVNSQKQLTGQTKLISLLESVHRFDEQSTVRGSVEGVSAFDFRQDNKDDWVRAGVGVEHTSPQGKFSLMLNGTSKANTPSSWLAVSWQQTF